jgi:autotransporter-associated beta strand protein
MERITPVLRRSLPKRALGVAAFPVVLLAMVCAGLAARVLPGSDTVFDYARASWFADFLPESWSDRADLRSQSQDSSPTADHALASENKVLPKHDTARSIMPAGFRAEISGAESDTARPLHQPTWDNNYSTPSIASLVHPMAPEIGVGTNTSTTRRAEVATALDPVWIGFFDNSWSQPLNWNPAIVPNGIGDVAEFQPAVADTNDMFTAQDVSGGVTLGRLTLAGTAARGWFVFLFTNTTFNNGGNGAVLSNTNTAVGNYVLHLGALGPPITLADNLAITNTSGSTSVFGSILIDAPFSGTGNITFNNVSNNPNAGEIFLQAGGSGTFTGTSTIASGAVVFVSSNPFGPATNPIFLGSTGGGSATLVSADVGRNIPNPITVVSGSGGTLTLGSIVPATSDSSTFSGVITLNDNLAITSSYTGTGALIFSNNITGPGGITKIGPGIVRLTSATDFTGATVVNSGILNPVVANSLGGTGSITVNNGGTLMLSGATNDRINDNADLILNAHGVITVALQTNGLSEHGLTNNTAGIGAVTLQSNSIIDLGTGASVIAFANSSGKSWTGTLSIYNWSGTPITGNGADQVYFGNNVTGLTPLQLNQINFYSDAGLTFIGTGSWGIDLDGEIVPSLVPVPEPATWIGGALALGAIGFASRRRLRPYRS